jgi:hypothetical protein
MEHILIGGVYSQCSPGSFTLCEARNELGIL